MSEEKTYYFLNDPSDKSLLKKISIPPPPNYLCINIEYDYKPTEITSSRFHSSSCYITLINCLNYFNKMLLNIKPLEKWAATNCLKINPLAGQKLNAYYSRHDLSFFYTKNPSTKKTVYTSDSSDIVAHELGHAILDLLRPDLWNQPAVEVQAFHEAFADITAIISIMQHEEVLSKALSETNGNMMKSNVISKLAEEVGAIAFNITNKQKGNLDSLRDVTNIFGYITPKKLPRKAPYAILANESHSFGRVFAGAWYEIMIRIFEDMKTKTPKKNKTLMLHHAKDVACKYLLKAVVQAPKTVRFTKSIAENMIYASKLDNKGYYKIIKDVFIERKILSTNIIGLLSTSSKSLDDVKMCLKKEDDIFEDKPRCFLRINNKRTIKPADYAITALTSDNPFLNAQIEVPTDIGYEFDSEGKVIEETYVDEQEIIQSAIDSAISIQQENKKVGRRKMWTVKNGKLLRNFID